MRAKPRWSSTNERGRTVSPGELHPVRGEGPGGERLVQHALPPAGPADLALLHHRLHHPLLRGTLHHCICTLLKVRQCGLTLV